LKSIIGMKGESSRLTPHAFLLLSATEAFFDNRSFSEGCSEDGTPVVLL